MFFTKGSRIQLSLHSISSNLPELIDDSIRQDEALEEKQYVIDSFIERIVDLYELRKTESDLQKKLRNQKGWTPEKEIVDFLKKSNHMCERLAKICSLSIVGLRNCSDNSKAIDQELLRLFDLGRKGPELVGVYTLNRKRLETLAKMENMFSLFINHLGAISSSCQNGIASAKSKKDLDAILRNLDVQKSNLIAVIKEEVELANQDGQILDFDQTLLQENIGPAGFAPAYEKLRKIKLKRRFARIAKIVAGTVLAANLMGIGVNVYLLTNHNPQGTNQTFFAERQSQFAQVRQKVHFQSRDGISLNGTIYRNPNADPTKVVILLHGISSNQTHLMPIVEKYLESYNVFTYDSRGAGENAHHSVGIGYEERLDLMGAMDFIGTQGFKDVFLHGRSMGAATIAFALGEEQVHGVNVKGAILQSCYANLGSSVKQFNNLFHMPPTISAPAKAIVEAIKGRSLEDIAPERELAKIRVPVLLVYDDNDPMTNPADPPRMIAQNHGNARSGVMTVHGSEHDDVSPGTLNGTLNFIKNNF